MTPQLSQIKIKWTKGVRADSVAGSQLKKKKKYTDKKKHTHKVVVPGDLTRNHEESEETIREQHLHSLIVGRQITFRIVALVCVLSTPLVATWRQLVGCERA